jgi:hypothetical protein
MLKWIYISLSILFSCFCHSQNKKLEEIFIEKSNIQFSKVDQNLKYLLNNYDILGNNHKVPSNKISFVKISDSIIVGRINYFNKKIKEPVYYIYDISNQEIHQLFEYRGIGLDFDKSDIKSISIVGIYNLKGQLKLILNIVFGEFEKCEIQIFEYVQDSCYNYHHASDPHLLEIPSKSNLYVEIKNCIAERTIDEYFKIIKKMKEIALSKPYKILEPNQFPGQLRKLK